MSLVTVLELQTMDYAHSTGPFVFMGANPTVDVAGNMDYAQNIGPFFAPSGLLPEVYTVTT